MSDHLEPILEHCICDKPRVTIMEDGSRYYITCSSCGLTGQKKLTPEKARGNWNEIINRLNYTLTHVAENVYLDVRKIYRNKGGRR